MRATRSSGSILITVLGLIAFLGLFTLAGTVFLRDQTQGAAQHEKSLRANYVAKGGLQLALEQLHLDELWGEGGTPKILLLDVSDDARLQARVQVWNNFNGTSDMSGPNSVVVRPGDVYLQSTGLIDGEEIRSKFGTADSTVVRPDAVMNYAIYDNDHGMSQQLGDAWIDAYDAVSEGLPPFYNWQSGQPTQPSTTPPYDGRGGSKVRCNGTTTLEQPVYGDVYKPSASEAVVPTIYGNIIDDDSPHTPMIFKIPPRLEFQLEQPMVYNIPLPPGTYGTVTTPSNSTLILDRGEYCFTELSLGEGSRVYLTEELSPPYTPAVVYVKQVFSVGVDCLVNMEPLAGGRDPQAEELQIYGTDGPGAPHTSMVFNNGSRFRGIAGGYKTIFRWGAPSGDSPATSGTTSPQGRDGVDIFGALYGKALNHEPGVRYHYDKALEGKKLEGYTQWFLVNSGNASH